MPSTPRISVISAASTPNPASNITLLLHDMLHSMKERR
jgi:hypothetical protein